MKIVIGKNAGFCFGVSNAIEKTKKELNQHHEAYCLGELVHNRQVIENLQRQGLYTINHIEEASGRTIIRAHGIPKNVYETASKNHIELVDLTCPKVLQIHKIVREYDQKGYHLIYVGVFNHPEAIGTISFASSYSFIKTLEDVEQVIQTIQDKHISKALLLVQTTFSMEKFQTIETALKEKLPKKCRLTIKNTICYATQKRQEETETMAQSVDAMIVIGGKHSSNTKKLYDIAKKHCPTFLIENEDEIQLEQMAKYITIGIMAGASTPKESIEAVVKKLEQPAIAAPIL